MCRRFGHTVAYVCLFDIFEYNLSSVLKDAAVSSELVSFRVVRGQTMAELSCLRGTNWESSNLAHRWVQFSNNYRNVFTTNMDCLCWKLSPSQDIQVDFEVKVDSIDFDFQISQLAYLFRNRVLFSSKKIFFFFLVLEFQGLECTKQVLYYWNCIPSPSPVFICRCSIQLETQIKCPEPEMLGIRGFHVLEAFIIWNIYIDCF